MFWGPSGPSLGPHLAFPGPFGPGNRSEIHVARSQFEIVPNGPKRARFRAMVFYASRKCPQKVPQKALPGHAEATPRCPKVARRSWKGPRKDPERSSDGCKNLQPRSLWAHPGAPPWVPPGGPSGYDTRCPADCGGIGNARKWSKNAPGPLPAGPRQNAPKMLQKWSKNGLWTHGGALS